MIHDRESLLGRAKIEVDRRTIARRWPGILTLAAIVSFLMLALLPREAAAHGSDHPPALRNSRNQFAFLQPPKPAPMTPILAEDGRMMVLDRYRGKVILLNLWATWCPPCVRELPALDRLQSALGGRDFTVMALSIDEADMAVPVSFVRGLGLENLDVYLDFTGTIAKAFPLYGLPITYLIDRRGLIIGYLVGAADWDSPEAMKFLNHYIVRDIVRPAPG
ncbi:MAG: TlpA family protein disulfide reductase [Proteobacteria bacterium]|nr:TlpA family protein disulfide reductase [Pseudomonadota bacterium]